MPVLGVGLAAPMFGALGGGAGFGLLAGAGSGMALGAGTYGTGALIGGGAQYAAGAPLMGAYGGAMGGTAGALSGPGAGVLTTMPGAEAWAGGMAGLNTPVSPGFWETSFGNQLQNQLIAQGVGTALGIPAALVQQFSGGGQQGQFPVDFPSPSSEVGALRARALENALVRSPASAGALAQRVPGITQSALEGLFDVDVDKDPLRGIGIRGGGELDRIGGYQDSILSGIGSAEDIMAREQALGGYVDPFLRARVQNPFGLTPGAEATLANVSGLERAELLRQRGLMEQALGTKFAGRYGPGWEQNLRFPGPGGEQSLFAANVGEPYLNALSKLLASQGTRRLNLPLDVSTRIEQPTAAGARTGYVGAGNVRNQLLNLGLTSAQNVLGTRADTFGRGMTTAANLIPNLAVAETAYLDQARQAYGTFGAEELRRSQIQAGAPVRTARDNAWAQLLAGGAEGGARALAQAALPRTEWRRVQLPGGGTELVPVTVGGFSNIADWYDTGSPTAVQRVAGQYVPEGDIPQGVDAAWLAALMDNTTRSGV